MISRPISTDALSVAPYLRVRFLCARRLASIAATVLTVTIAGCQPVDRTPLPVLGRVVDFALVDQAGSAVTRASLTGAPWVADFIFTRCATVCPRVTQRMHALQALARHGDRLRLVTFSVDPEHDQPAILKRYADAYGADQATWTFLTGSAAAIDAIARSFAVALSGTADPSKADFGIMHSGQLVLVDEQGRIRGYYPSSEEGVEQRLLADVRRLDAAPGQVAKAQ